MVCPHTDQGLRCLVVFLLAFATSSFADPPDCGTWNLAWQDEFEGTAVDESKWTYGLGWGISITGYSCSKSGIEVSNGTAKLLLRNQECGGRKYSGAALTCKFRPLYGYFEARLRCPNFSHGHWHNFWMNGCNDWPPEFNMAEMIGNKPDSIYLCHHYDDENGKHREAGAMLPASPREWHVYGIEWLKGRNPRYFIDGMLAHTSTQPAPDVCMYMILRLGAGYDNQWGGLPDNSTKFPGIAEYDWVKYWEKTGESACVDPVPYSRGASNTFMPARRKGRSGDVNAADELRLFDVRGRMLDPNRGVRSHRGIVVGKTVTGAVRIWTMESMSKNNEGRQ